MGAKAGGQSAGPDGGHRPPLCSRLQKTEARRDAQLFLAAAQTLGRPIKLHQMDAFLRGYTVGLGPSSSAQGPIKGISASDTRGIRTLLIRNWILPQLHLGWEKKGDFLWEGRTHTGMGNVHTERPRLESNSINAQIKKVSPRGRVMVANPGWPGGLQSN